MSSLSSEFSEFLQGCVRSASELTVLLQLARDERRAWTVLETAFAARCDPDRAEQALEALIQRGLASRKDAPPGAQYRYDPRSVELRAHVATLDQFDQQQPVSLIRAIYGLPFEDHNTQKRFVRSDAHE